MTTNQDKPTLPSRLERSREKMARIPVKVVPLEQPLRKPAWIRTRAPTGGGFNRVKTLLREHGLHTVCEEAACPNIGECFSGGTATFMILGNQCTRRCPFCDVGHGKPGPVDPAEAERLAHAVKSLGLDYVVVTSVDRDDLQDGGAAHFAHCIQAIRLDSPQTRIEVLVPDFRGRMETALDILERQPPDVFNHNIESVPRLYRAVRPGADYQHSLSLLRQFRLRCPDVPTKSGLMVGLGEENHEVEQTMADLRQHDVQMLTIGQYLQPTPYHLPVLRYARPEEFDRFAVLGEELGFSNVASGPMVRSSYHADRQAKGRPLG